MMNILKYSVFFLAALGYLVIQITHAVAKPLDQALSLWYSGIIGIMLGAYGYYLFGRSKN
ncbi:hypothetical protein CA267_017415 [Alteromonas pelagimontana]|uniref:Uncharacterized protein n=1 Tax=Alteromonas pelagimontana TaxID=1858656 RepID=A0A6M4MIG7_9ALTE|nr:hypothetical protein [Alteromonas pelagimontana]QJR82400.1 hypothetical protein CA267_017415 [Alteromonas pelagimontana]